MSLLVWYRLDAWKEKDLVFKCEWENTYNHGKEMSLEEITGVIVAGAPETCETEGIYYKCCPKLVNLEEM